MINPILVTLAVEDVLSEFVLREIIRQSQRPYMVVNCLCRGGYGYLKKNIRHFNEAAQGIPFLVLTDLDRAECPPTLIKKWLPYPTHPNLLFRIAVREVEAWLLAHRDAFAQFLGISEKLIPKEVDAISDPKQLLINLAARSKKRELRQAIAPHAGKTATIGPNYNGKLKEFVITDWQAKIAACCSPSLQRTVNAIATFEPTCSD
jgi:hypothetical protein